MILREWGISYIISLDNKILNKIVVKMIFRMILIQTIIDFKNHD